MKRTPAPDPAVQTQFDFGTQGRGSIWLRPPRGYDADALFSRGVELEAGDVREALAVYGEAIAVDPRHVDAHVNRGRLLHQLGQIREAETHYASALAARPTDCTALFNLAVVLEDQGRIDDAIERYLEALNLDGACIDAHFNLARLYEKKGEKMSAIRHLKDYRRLLEK
jgi:tetratricopeptide (TPR) repeat protein